MHMGTYAQLHTAVLWARRGFRLLHREDISPSQRVNLVPLRMKFADPWRDEVMGQRPMKTSLAAPVSEWRRPIFGFGAFTSVLPVRRAWKL